jgi:hypothetical protein
MPDRGDGSLNSLRAAYRAALVRADRAPARQQLDACRDLEVARAALIAAEQAADAPANAPAPPVAVEREQTAPERARVSAREAFARVQARQAQNATDTARATDAAALPRSVESDVDPLQGHTEGTGTP